MINRKSLEQVKNSKLNSRFFKPDSKYNIKYLLNDVYRSLGLKHGTTLPYDCFGEKQKKYDHMILILLDGFSYYLLEKYLPFLSEKERNFYEEQSRISKITTMFPSTTSAIIPFVTTGYLPEESGIYEWWQYEGNSEEVFCPFTSQYKEDGIKKYISETGVDLEEVYKRSKLYEDLDDHGISVNLYSKLYETPFNHISNNGFKVNNFERFSEYLEHYKSVDLGKKSFTYMYDPNIDMMQHIRGVDSLEVKQTVLELLGQIYLLAQDVKNRNLNTQIMIVADHGLVGFDFRKMVSLGEKIPNVERYLKQNSKGEKITEGGCPRDIFLHLQDDFVDEFISLVRKDLEECCEVYTTEDFFKQGIFNSEVSNMESFKKNIGNVVILPYEGESVWLEKDPTLISYKALHGGLSEKELHIPFIVI